MFDRADAIDHAFQHCVSTGEFPESAAGKHDDTNRLPDTLLIDLFDTQVTSRHLDLFARRSKGKTFYSIGSAGHEGMAALAAATRPTDMAFLHYRDGAFLIHRAKQVPGSTPTYDMALSFAASAEDPVSGGRHKVLGGKALFVPPQTSTIASHLPKAVGAAFSIGTARKLRKTNGPLPADSIVIVSFGDASANHSTAQGAINTACWSGYQGSPMPILFVCEDNDIGISVPTPHGWIAANFSNRPALAYFSCNGCNLSDCLPVMEDAVRYCRTERKPAFLHVKTVRLMGHAGADIEAAYTAIDRIEHCERRDPLLVTADLILRRGLLSSDDLMARYERARARIARIGGRAITRPKLNHSDQVMASLVPPTKETTNPAPLPVLSNPETNANKPVPLSRHLNLALREILSSGSEAVIFGEDVGKKGGVYGVTGGLQKDFGRARVFDTLLDEQAILGLAIGMAHNGFVPIPEIQFLAYLHNAEDQIRGEAATLPFFSNGQFSNPMVLRIAGLGYQKGFGGHFHNDNSFAVLRDIPGLILACPSTGPDAPCHVAGGIPAGP